MAKSGNKKAARQSDPEADSAGQAMRKELSRFLPSSPLSAKRQQKLVARAVEWAAAIKAALYVPGAHETIVRAEYELITLRAITLAKLGIGLGESLDISSDFIAATKACLTIGG